MRRADYLRPLYADRPDREERDRMEMLTALIDGPSFDPVYRPDVIQIPRGHPIYRWECVVDTCERTRCGGTDFCSEHRRQWAKDKARGVGKAAFLTAAQGLERHVGTEETPCRVCPQRPAANTDLRLCQRHYGRWLKHTKATGGAADFTEWLGEQRPGPGYGSCLVTVCVNMADNPLGLCSWHDSAYRRDGSPATSAHSR